MDSIRDNVDPESFTTLVIKYLRVNGSSYGEGIVQRRPFRYGENFSIGAREERHDLREQSSKSGRSTFRVDSGRTKGIFRSV
jgi:hypothetical protein